MPEADGDQASSAESSSFDTDDEKGTGREIEIYLTVVLDKAEGFLQDWRDSPSYSGTRPTSVNSGVTVEVEDDDINILQVYVN